MLLAVPVSIYEVAMQLEYFSRPKLQIRVIRILWMVPIYALDAWLALRFEVRGKRFLFSSCAHNLCYACTPQTCTLHGVVHING